MIPDCEPNYGYLITGCAFLLAAMIVAAVIVYNLL